LGTHLSIICDFWEILLWGGEKYQDNLIQKHSDFNKNIALTPLHLERWLLYWNTTLTENFSAENTEEIKKSCYYW